MKAIVIGVISFLVSLVLLTISAFGYAVKGSADCYSAYTETGVHLIMSDNGTPNDIEDDYICDYETNRIFEITITR